MAHAEVLQELARQVRGDTLQIFDAAQPGWLLWVPPGTSNHMLWHAGHALWLQDLMSVEVLSGNSELPAGWAAFFASGSQPGTIGDWPDRHELRTALALQLDRMLQLFGQASAVTLRNPPGTLSDKRTTLGWILHGLHDEAKHSGEMYLLWKQCRSRARHGRPE